MSKSLLSLSYWLMVSFLFLLLLSLFFSSQHRAQISELFFTVILASPFFWCLFLSLFNIQYSNILTKEEKRKREKEPSRLCSECLFLSLFLVLVDDCVWIWRIFFGGFVGGLTSDFCLNLPSNLLFINLEIHTFIFAQLPSLTHSLTHSIPPKWLKWALLALLSFFLSLFLSFSLSFTLTH